MFQQKIFGFRGAASGHYKPTETEDLILVQLSPLSYRLRYV